MAVSDDIEVVVEDTKLPRRLKDEVYDVINEKSVMDVETADQIANQVEEHYIDLRVDPLDPVGTVSAQSIGEPGTQMSVPYDERVIVRQNEETQVTEIGSLVDSLMASRETRAFDEHEVSLAPNGLEALSLGRDEQVHWKPIEEISRHETPDELLQLALESGRTVRATKAHSFVTRENGEIVPVRGDSLSVGDWIPVVGEYDDNNGKADFTEILAGPSGSPTTLTDGGVTISQNENASPSATLGTVDWDRIESIETVESEYEHVYDFSVEGLETFTTGEGVVTHNTMNTFHYAGVAEIDITQGLPRLIELVDARKTPDTPTMKVHIEDEYAFDREKAHEVIWKIESTRVLALGDVSTNVADMLVSINLNEETLRERWPTVETLETIVTEIAETIESKLGVETLHKGTTIEFGPEEPSYRDLLQLVEELREIVFKGISDISRVVIRKEELEEGEDREFVLYTEGSAFGKVLEIEGVDASRTTTNNIHEVYRVLGVEASRERIIEETMNTLEEQGLGDVNIRHLMLVSDIMTNRGTIESIGRHGISGNKESVLARAAFEVTVNHLLDAAIHGESDALDGVTENVIVGKPIKLGTGDVTLKMGSVARGERE